MNKAEEPWYWHNLNVATALILLVAMIALCSLLAPDRMGKVTMYQNDNLTIQCIEKKAGACERVTVKDKGVKNETNNR
jgi:hypothetical protein